MNAWKAGGAVLTKDYFEHQLERIREIRLSLHMFYQKITDLYATALDYDKTAAWRRDSLPLCRMKCISLSTAELQPKSLRIAQYGLIDLVGCGKISTEIAMIHSSGIITRKILVSSRALVRSLVKGGKVGKETNLLQCTRRWSVWSGLKRVFSTLVNGFCLKQSGLFERR